MLERFVCNFCPWNKRFKLCMLVGLDFWGWRFENFCSIPGWFVVICWFSSYSMQTCYLSHSGCPSQSRHTKIASWPAIFDDRSRAPQEGGLQRSAYSIADSTAGSQTLIWRRWSAEFPTWTIPHWFWQIVMIFMDFGVWMPKTVRNDLWPL